VTRKRVASGSPYEKEYGFSRAVCVGDRILVGGTAPIWPDDVVDLDVRVQTKRCLQIILACLERLGAGAEHVVRTRVYLTDRADADVVGSVHGEVFGDIRPVTSMVVVAGLLDERWKVEIEAEAVLTLPDDSGSVA
jgi:enamine deaminase RidA (YjgF/YER057c/UK114 family)